LSTARVSALVAVALRLSVTWAVKLVLDVPAGGVPEITPVLAFRLAQAPICRLYEEQRRSVSHSYAAMVTFAAPIA